MSRDNHSTFAVEQAKAVHWQDLAEEAERIRQGLTRQAKPKELPENTVIGVPLTPLIKHLPVRISESFLAQNLLLHLKVEFPELPWDELQGADVPPELFEVLQLVAARRTFKGVCDICREWDRVQDCPAPATMQVVNKFLTAKRGANITGASLKSYKDTLRPFAHIFPTLPARPEQIDEYLAPHRGKNSTAWNIYTVIRLLYGFAEDRGLLPFPNPMTKVQRPKKMTKPPQHLTTTQAEALLGAIQTDRERGLVYCLFGLGLRLSEVQRLEVADIGEDTILVHGKERDESLPLPAQIRGVLLKLAEGKRADEPIFQGRQGPLSDSQIQNIVKKLFTRANITGVRPSPHTLRHSKGVLSTMLGLDQFSNKRLLRHASIEMTDRYNQLNLEELRVKDLQYNPLLRLLNKAELGKKPDYAQCQPNVGVASLAKEPYTEAE